MGVGGLYGALARLAGPTGAEWSLFWPGSGMAADSCAALIALFDRPGVAAAPVALAAGNTDSADGTDGSAAVPALATDPADAGVSAIGFGGVVGVLSQAPSQSTDAQSAVTANGKRMAVLDGFISGGFSALCRA